jgi:hypothetical protein
MARAAGQSHSGPPGSAKAAGPSTPRGGVAGGRCVAIFPEGTLTTTPNVAHARQDGVARIASPRAVPRAERPVGGPRVIPGSSHCPTVRARGWTCSALPPSTSTTSTAALVGTVSARRRPDHAPADRRRLDCAARRPRSGWERRVHGDGKGLRRRAKPRRATSDRGHARAPAPFVDRAHATQAMITVLGRARGHDIREGARRRRHRATVVGT